MCFIVNLFRWVVVWSAISLFVSFRYDNSYDKVRCDKVIKSNPVHQYAVNMKSQVFQAFLDYQLFKS